MKCRILSGVFIGLVAMGCPAEQAFTNSTAMVMFHGQNLFEVSNIETLSAHARVKTITTDIKALAKSPLVNTENIYVYNHDRLPISAIMYKDEAIVAVWEEDAARLGRPREKIADFWKEQIIQSIEAYRLDHTRSNYIKGATFAVIATLILMVANLLVRRLCKREMAAVERKFAGQQMFKFLDGDSVILVNGYLIKLIRAAILLVLLVIYLNVVLSFFPWTFNLSAKLFNLVTHPIINFGNAFVENLPNLFALLVLIGITMFILRTLKHIFRQIEEGRVRLRGFYRDWAEPTYRLVRLLVIVFAAVVAFPLIPGSSSPAFKGISIFMGVLVSLGSSSAVGNIVAGLVLTYMRPFVTNDFVEIGGLRGTVESRGTFSTLLKTPTHEIVSIPNASVSSNHIINFSRMAQRGGVNVGTAVTIGYDVPWRKVHELLIESANGVEDVLVSPPPKVLQLSLDDFYVQYKLIVTTKYPERRITICSNLHKNIQDNFARAGVEIMSPHYQSNRVGDASTIPDMTAAEPDV